MAGKKIYIAPNQPDSHQAVNWAGITILSFNRKDTVYQSDGDIDVTNQMSVTNYTIVSDILKITVNSSKASYLSTAEAVLSSGDINYQSVINPGDHALIWIHNDIGQFNRVMGAAATNQPANDINSGLKFIGRVNSVRSNYDTTANGIKTLRFTVTFKGFYELSTMAYYNRFTSPDVKGNQGNAELIKGAQILAQMTHEWNSYFFESEKRSLSVQSIVVFLMAIFFGAGPDKTGQQVADVPRSPNRAFLVPKELLGILGLKPSNTKEPNYSDVLHGFFGVQSYNGGKSTPDFVTTVKPPLSSRTRHFTANSVYGNMLALPDQFNNVPLWSLMQQYSNLQLNEIFTSVRLNDHNKIVPVFTMRQIPFTTEYIQDRFERMDIDQNIANSIAYTKFKDLPRWVVDSRRMINSFNLGTSDAGRHNFFQIYGQLFGASFNNPIASQQAQIVRGNYQIEDIDIMRNGLRSLIGSTAVDLTVNSNNSNIDDLKIWTALVSDWYANNHLKLSGSVNMSGVSEPVAPGDNVQITDKLFHIEEVTHYYEQMGDAPAYKVFYTTLGLSNGILVNTKYEIAEPHLREHLHGSLVPGYSDEEKYINDVPIVSGAERHTKKGTNNQG